MTDPWAPLMPLIVVFAAALTVFALELVIRRPGPWLPAVSSLGLTVALVSAATAPVVAESRFGGLVVFDGPGRLASLVVIAAALAVAIASADFEKSDSNVGEFYSLLMFAAFGGLLLSIAGDLIVLFLGLEAMSLPLYALVTWRRTDRRAFEGALRYFLLGAFATSIMVFGMSLLIGASGTTRLAEIGAGMVARQSSLALVLLGMGFTGVGLLFKLGAAPFHFWVMDAYEASIPSVGGLLAVLPKIATLAVLVRLLSGLAPYARVWGPGLAALAVLSMAVGNLGGLRQRSVARLLGYSSVAQTGYVLIGLAVASPAAISASMTYFTVYAVAAMGAFLTMAAVRPKDAGSLDDLVGFGHAHPALGVSLAVFMLSLIGIPPLAGFFGKLTLFAAAIGRGYAWLALTGLAFSVVSLGYYGAVLKHAFLVEGVFEKGREPGSAGLAVAGLAALTVLVALVPWAVFVPLVG